MGSRGHGVAICHGDTAKLPGARTLRLGAATRFGVFTCSSPAAGAIRCASPARHGFSLSPSRQFVY